MKTLFTKEELIKHLTDELEDELEGIIHYDKVYESFRGLGLRCDAKDIERIATDEYDHAITIMDILKEHGVDVSMHPRIVELWDEVKKIYSIT